MDGERALKYVRSRHAEGSEGNDFARGRRQQEVILALKNKLLTKDIYLKSGEIERLYTAFDAATDTDMTIGELLTVGKLFLKTTEGNTTRIPLEDQLYTPPSSWYGRFVLLPKDGIDAVHSYIRDRLK